MQTGHAPGKGQAAGGMAEAVQNSLQFLPKANLKAIAAYLKASPPVAEPHLNTPVDQHGAAQPVHDKAELGAIFTRLCEQVAGDLQRKGFVGRTIGIRLRYDNFQIVTRDQSLPLPVHEATAIRRVAGQCLKRVDLSRRLRLLGVRVSALRRADEVDANTGWAVGESLPLF